MNVKSLTVVALLCAILYAGKIEARIIAPNNCGDLFRSKAMLADKNYQGSADQLTLINPSALTSNQEEQKAWLECVSQSHLDIDRAVMLLEDFVDEYGASPERFKAMMLLGDCRLAGGEPHQALSYYNKVAMESLSAEDKAALAYHKGYAYLEIGENEQAEDFMKMASANKEWRPAADFYLGYLAYTKKDFDRAKWLLGQSDRSEMPGAMADFYLSQIYYAEGDYQKALTTARNLAVRNDVPQEFSAEAVRVAGESMFQLGETRNAVRELRKYLDMTDSPERSALYIVGVSEFNSARPVEAVKLLKGVTDYDDAMAQSAYLYIGQALLTQNDLDAAILAFDKALKMDYDKDVREAAFYNYAVAKSSGARVPFGSSVSIFEEFLSKFPNGKYAPVVQEYLVEGYLTGGDYDGALQSINRMKNPSAKVIDAKQKVLYAIGYRALATNDVDRAVATLREAHSMKRDRVTDAQVALSLGEALARKGAHDEAIGHFKQYLNTAPTNDPNRDIAFYDLGYSYFALKDYANASKNFTKIAGIKSGPLQPANLQVDVLNRLADSKLYLGEYTEAMKLYRQAYDTNPQAGDYPLFQTAIIQGYARNHKAKIETLYDLLEKFPSSSLVPDALLQITESQIQLGDNDAAISTYRRLVAEYPSTEQGRRGYLQMALTLLNSGKRTEAITAYKDVVTLYPSSEEARMSIEELKRIYADDGNLPQLASWLGTIDGAPQLDIVQADRLSYESAEKYWITEHNPSRLESYIEEFPTGSYRVRALGYLIDNAVEKNNQPRVIEYATEIIEKYPDSSQAENALYARANAQYDLGMSKEALESWTMLEHRASSPGMLTAAQTGVLRSARDLGDHNRVIDTADALLASSAIGADARNEAEFARAYALARTGAELQAIGIWERLAENTADINGVKSAYYLAEYRFNSGRIDEARRLVEALIDSGTPHQYWLARGFILLSDIYAKENKDFEAREYLKSLRDNYPGNEPDIFRMIDERLN